MSGSIDDLLTLARSALNDLEDGKPLSGVIRKALRVAV
jgi:hypothetical protein